MNRVARVVTMSLVAAIAAAVATLAGSPAPAALSAPAAPRPGAPSTNPGQQDGNRVVRVYYFHTTQRCASCKKIEALSAEAIRSGFERELRDGTLEWHAVNLDEPGNQHFVHDYELYTKSLVVVDVANGRQERWKNLPKIWELLRDEAAFRQYVQGEARAYLEKGP